MKKIKGMTALVTGGASGMGKLWVKRFLRDGANVVVWDINESLLEKLNQEIEKEFLRRIKTYKVDVSSVNEIETVYNAIKREKINVDIVVNNAGVVFKGFTHESYINKINKLLSINLNAVIVITKLFLKDMIKRGRGHIINISSAAGFIGVPLMSTYCASKWGVIGFSESVRYELKMKKLKNVKITVFCPSYISTGMFEGAKPPLFTKLLTPERAVDIAYRGFKKNRFCIKTPWIVKITPFLKGVLPRFLYDLTYYLFNVDKSMTNWRGRGNE